MNAETLTKRLKSATRSSVVRSLVWELVRHNYARPNYTSGSGRHTRICIHLPDLLETCKRVGIDVASGNDAPRGGLCGAWVELTRKGRRDTEKIRATEQAEAESAARAEQERKAEKERLKAARLDVLEARLRKDLSPREVLELWSLHGSIHPAPDLVVDAKVALGLSWSEVSMMCKSSYVPARQGE